jgi:hypothetical protein
LLHFLQRGDEAPRVGKTGLPVALQRLPDHAVELGRHLHSRVPSFERQGVLGEALEDEAVLVLGVEGRQPRDHLVDHEGQGVEVAPVVEVRACGHAGLLGRAVLELAHEHPHLGDLQVGVHFERPREPEVDDLQPELAVLVLRDHQVVGREVPMDDPDRVDGVQAVEGLDAETDRRQHREGPLPPDAVAHVLPLDVLPDHVEAAVLEGREVVEARDVRVLDLGREPRLAHEPLLGRRIGRQILAQDLDHPQLLQVDVTHQVDLPHPAAAQALDDLVLAVEDGPRLTRAQRVQIDTSELKKGSIVAGRRGFRREKRGAAAAAPRIPV